MNLGGLSDFFDDVGNGINDVAKDVGHSIDDFYHGVEKTGQTAYNNVDDVGKAAGEQLGLNFRLPYETLTNVLKNPGSDDSYFSALTDWTRKSNDIGTELFGDGGYVKGGLDAIGYATVGVPVGSVAWQADAAAENKKYNGGLVQPYQSLYGLGQTASNVYNSTTTPTYNEVGPNGSEVTVTPSNYYNTATADAANLNNGLNTSYTEQGTPGFGSDVNPYAYGQEGLGLPDTTATAGSPGFFDTLKGYYNEYSGYLNSPTGRVVTQVAGHSNPIAAQLTQLASSGGDGGGMGQAVDALGSLYKGYQTRRQEQKTGDELKQQLNAALDTYSPTSAYGQQLRKTLERQDAAAGRRSQYGTREVELAARLADKQNSVRQAYMQQAPTLAGMNSRIAGANNAGVSDLLTLYGKNFNKVNSTVANTGKSLYDYFTQPSQASQFDAGSMPLFNQG